MCNLPRQTSLISLVTLIVLAGVLAPGAALASPPIPDAPPDALQPQGFTGYYWRFDEDEMAEIIDLSLQLGAHLSVGDDGYLYLDVEDEAALAEALGVDEDFLRHFHDGLDGISWMVERHWLEMDDDYYLSMGPEIPINRRYDEPAAQPAERAGDGASPEHIIVIPGCGCGPIYGGYRYPPPQDVRFYLNTTEYDVPFNYASFAPTLAASARQGWTAARYAILFSLHVDWFNATFADGAIAFVQARTFYERLRHNLFLWRDEDVYRWQGRYLFH
jgi:hypothetical protein